jgi:serine/threonine-protein kinase
VERIGEGGMGEVWRAEHHLLARPAAIKLIRSEVLDEKSGSSTTEGNTIRRFEREAQATSSLMSPNTVDLYDFGASERGDFFFVMELLQGMDAQTLVERLGPLPVERAVFVLEQVCRSLSEAHRRELVHRDIKPANIFVCRYGLDDDFVKVLDFGLVKGTPGAKGAGTRLTLQNAAAGTPAYMPPEVGLGDPEVGPGSDLYSLGCVAFFLVTGRTVFEADTAIAMALKHVHEQPEPPSAHSERPVPHEYDELVMRCLAKKPDERVRNAEELLTLLQAVPRERWTPDRAHGWWEQNAPEIKPYAEPAPQPS